MALIMFFLCRIWKLKLVSFLHLELDLLLGSHGGFDIYLHRLVVDISACNDWSKNNENGGSDYNDQQGCLVISFSGCFPFSLLLNDLLLLDGFFIVDSLFILRNSNISSELVFLSLNRVLRVGKCWCEYNWVVTLGCNNTPCNDFLGNNT